MKTVDQLGLIVRKRDHGRAVTLDEFESAQSPGVRSELIDGRIFVSPVPEANHDFLVRWLQRALDRYWDANPSIVKYVTPTGRVFVPGKRRSTCPEPDLAVYARFPRFVPKQVVRWKAVSPIVVVEVVSSTYDKDLVRNVKLYERVPSIQEYWIVLDDEDTDDLLFRVYRRSAGKWMSAIDHGVGDHFQSTALPGFRLTIEPRL